MDRTPFIFSFLGSEWPHYLLPVYITKSIPRPTHNNSEDGEIMFLRNVGIGIYDHNPEDNEMNSYCRRNLQIYVSIIQYSR